ncbi:efflux RND transporter periplasmic adaptor subunit [Vibrio algivorus]|uniref:MexH family multidrug efflux RND transporter periplasmic adaptor subunit n=1 Tax=Vibrio algivorus TaxID=1667024 RepID=A0ABQ6ENF2_9VIBR|nr:efflux RND transporter periplasmic adaptor subunit [Vibrio algivorus]GLT14665.1 MexH family multidrug efflux RND transporter periplasmic adaptor subunit [Vibrio algivorus]
MKKWTFVMLIIAILLFGSVIGFNMFKQKKIAEYMANMPEPEFPVTVVKVTPEDWTPTIDAIGFVEPNQGVTLTAQASGQIDKIHFDSGIDVKKNDVLVEVDSKVEKAQLKSSQSRLPAAQAKYVRYKDLYSKGSVSKEAFDNAQADYLSLSADIESLKASIDRRTVTAPFDGTVGLRNVFNGQFLETGAEVVRLEDMSVMRLRFTVPQTDISKIHVGQQVNINVDSYADKTFKGSISAISPAVNAQSGLIQVQAQIPNNDGKLRSGMFARASIVLPTIHDQIIAPQTAITYTLYGDSIYVLEEKDGVQRVTQTVVKVGERAGSVAHILDGLKPGQTIVTSGQVRLSNNSKVKVVESDATTPPAQTPML